MARFTRSIRLNLDERTHAELQQEAEELGFSLAAYARSILMRHLSERSSHNQRRLKPKAARTSAP